MAMAEDGIEIEQKTEHSTTALLPISELLVEGKGTTSPLPLHNENCNEEKAVDKKGKNLLSECHSSSMNLSDFVRFGRYSVFIIILYEVLLLPQMGNMTFMMYGGLSPRVLSCANVSFAHIVRPEDACAAFRRSVEGNDGLCADGQRPKTDAQFGSIANEFNYVCDRIVHVKKSISAQMFGVLCGSIIFGQCSDWFGRKRVMLLAHFGMALFNYAASMAQSLAHFTALQFVAMLFVGGHNTIMHVFLMENMPKRHRVLVMNAISFSPNYIVFAGIAYATGEWRTLLRLIALLNIPAFVGLLFAFESPRWIISKGKLEEAKRMLTKMERMNGTGTAERLKHIEEIIQREKKMSELQKRGKKYHYLHLFYTWRLGTYTAVISYSLLSISVVSYSMVFGMDTLSGSIYLNTALFGLSRYAMNLLVGAIDFFAPRAGRRQMYVGAVVLILAAFGATVVAKSIAWSDPLLVRSLMILAAALCSQLYILNHVVTSELFPTPIRNIAASFVQVANRTGVVLSPHLFLLSAVWPALPFLVMLALLALNLLLYLAFIPETKGRPLADHMPERKCGPFEERRQTGEEKDEKIGKEHITNIEMGQK